jgi:hypothetical protein
MDSFPTEAAIPASSRRPLRCSDVGRGAVAPSPPVFNSILESNPLFSGQLTALFLGARTGSSELPTLVKYNIVVIRLAQRPVRQARCGRRLFFTTN